MEINERSNGILWTLGYEEIAVYSSGNLYAEHPKYLTVFGRFHLTNYLSLVEVRKSGYIVCYQYPKNIQLIKSRGKCQGIVIILNDGKSISTEVITEDIILKLIQDAEY